jgi:hypothetical protein
MAFLYPYLIHLCAFVYHEMKDSECRLEHYLIGYAKKVFDLIAEERKIDFMTSDPKL